MSDDETWRQMRALRRALKRTLATMETAEAKPAKVRAPRPGLHGIDQLVMLATLRAQPEAYGVAVHAELAKRVDDPPVVSAIYAALDRLAERGLLTGEPSDRAPGRGRRTQRLFRITPAGMAALNRSLRTIDAFREGIAA